MLTDKFFWANYGAFAVTYTAAQIAGAVAFGVPPAVATVVLFSGLGVFPIGYGVAQGNQQPVTVPSAEPR